MKTLYRISGAVGAGYSLYAVVNAVPLIWGHSLPVAIWIGLAGTMMFVLHAFQFVFGHSPFGDGE